MQSNSARALVGVAALVLVIVLFVVFQGEDEAGEGSSQEPVAPTATTENTAEDPAGSGAETPAEQRAPADAGGPRILVESGEPVEGVADLEFDKGDRVRFTVDSDAVEEIHVHGYDLYFDLAAGKPTEVDFAADIDGLFEVELHGSGALIGELTVNP